MINEKDNGEGFLSPARIAEHNAEVAAFRAEHYPRIEALTDDECRRIYERWTAPGVDMAANRLALEFRDDLGMTWPETHAVAIGIKMVQTVLERLDKHDPDFRPSPEPQDMGNIGDAVLRYLPETHRFRVELGGLSEEFPATYAPRFGVDASDMRFAREVAERLSSAAGKGATPSVLGS